MNDRVYTTSVTEGGKEEITSQVIVDFARNPQNMRELVQGIRKLVPETHDKFEEVYALIKTFVHKEKHFYWNDLKHWIDAGPEFLHKIADGKKETHSVDAWQNFDKNLEWAKQYQERDTRVKVNGVAVYLRNNHQENTYDEILRRHGIGSEADLVKYQHFASGLEGILNKGETRTFPEDTVITIRYKVQVLHYITYKEIKVPNNLKIG